MIELVIMILIFALAAALCLQAFVWAQQQSEEIALRDDAVLAVQNAAEMLKSSNGDLTEVENNHNFTVHVEMLEVNMEGLGSAEITAYKVADDSKIFSMQVCWQKPLKGGAANE